MAKATLPHRDPSRGEVWQVDLRPARGREQDGPRPAVIISEDRFNHGPADMVIVIPVTSRNKKIPSHVFVPKGEAGLTLDSYVKVEDVRAISKERLIAYLGDLTSPRVERVEQILRVLLKL
ncbi:MAG: type II toxin-antitoxin system PemK/MazF family toxin [Gemmatimonadaceae bacterium]